MFVRCAASAIFCGLILLLSTTFVRAQEAPEVSIVKIGEKAADFEIPIVTFVDAQPQIEMTSVKQYRWQKHLLLFFVPMTGGHRLLSLINMVRTEEEFFETQRTLPVFIMRSTPAQCIEIKKVNRLWCALVSDPEGKIVQHYGIPGGGDMSSWITGSETWICAALVGKTGLLEYRDQTFNPETDFEYVCFWLTLLNRSGADQTLKKYRHLVRGDEKEDLVLYDENEEDPSPQEPSPEPPTTKK